MIETGRDFAQCLDAANRTSLAPLVTRLSRESDRPAVERALRDAWTELVAEIATWAPARWRPAILWLRTLPYLRLGPSAWAAHGLTRDEQALLDSDPDSIARRWRAGFTHRLPASIGPVAPLLDRFTDGPPRPASDTQGLTANLETLFRRRAQTPTALFAWLGLAALTLERLRGALLLALLFPANNAARAS